jgi:hypothetical protein
MNIGADVDLLRIQVDRPVAAQWEVQARLPRCAAAVGVQLNAHGQRLATEVRLIDARTHTRFKALFIGEVVLQTPPAFIEAVNQGHKFTPSQIRKGPTTQRHVACGKSKDGIAFSRTVQHRTDKLQSPCPTTDWLLKTDQRRCTMASVDALWFMV